MEGMSQGSLFDGRAPFVLIWATWEAFWLRRTFLYTSGSQRRLERSGLFGWQIPLKTLFYFLEGRLCPIPEGVSFRTDPRVFAETGIIIKDEFAGMISSARQKRKKPHAMAQACRNYFLSPSQNPSDRRLFSGLESHSAKQEMLGRP